MKRELIWALAIVPLIFSPAMAEPLVDKSPRLVARNFEVVELIFSTDGKWLFGDNGFMVGQTLALTGGARARIFSDSQDNFIGFSPDDKWIFQLGLDSYEGFIDDEGYDFRNPTPDGIIGIVGRSTREGSKETIRFTFTGARADFYGAYLRDDEIIVESREMTYHLDAHNLRVLRTEPQTRTLRNVIWLLGDGKTVLVSGGRLGLKFVDLPTEKTLWTQPYGAGSGFRFTLDGRLILRMESGVIVAREARTAKEVWRFRGPASRYFWLSPDQTAIYEARPNGELWKWPR